MQILPTLLVSAAATFSPSAPIHRTDPRTDPVLVRAVIDGDTIDVAAVGRVRLLGIDAPEVSHGLDTTAPFGREARDKLSSLVLYRWIRLEQDGTLTDAYSRRLAYVVRTDGLFVNAALVREGLARVSARMPLARLTELKRAEAEAQGFRRGMWGAAPQIPSSSYTRRLDTRKPATSRSKAPPTAQPKPHQAEKRRKSARARGARAAAPGVLPAQ